MKRLIPYSAMLATLVLAYSFDRWVVRLQEEATRTFVLTPYLVGTRLINLLMSAVLLVLAWLALAWRGSDRITAGGFILAGALGLLWPVLALVLPQLDPAQHMTPHLDVSSAFVLVIGVVGLFPQLRQIQRNPKS